MVELDDIERFVEKYKALENHQHYEVFVTYYGLRKTSEDFWIHADWFSEKYVQEQP